METDSLNNLCIFGLSRSGTTIVSQVLANYLYDKNLGYHPVYQAELTNVYLNHLMVDGTRVSSYQKGAHLKSYDFDKNGYLVYVENFNITKPFEKQEMKDEFLSRLDKLVIMMNSDKKSVFKINPYAIKSYYDFDRTYDVLSKLNYIYVIRRNKLEHFLSFIIANTTGVFHTEIDVDFSKIRMTDNHKRTFKNYFDAEKYVIKKLNPNIISTVYYEDITSNFQILDLLGLHDWQNVINTDVKFRKKINYGCNKIDLIENKDEVLKFINEFEN